MNLHVKKLMTLPSRACLTRAATAILWGVPVVSAPKLSPHSSPHMSLRLAAPTLRSTARLVARQQPMGLVKIHSCEFSYYAFILDNHVDAGKTVYISRRCKEQCRRIDQPCS